MRCYGKFARSKVHRGNIDVPRVRIGIGCKRRTPIVTAGAGTMAKNIGPAVAVAETLRAHRLRGALAGVGNAVHQAQRLRHQQQYRKPLQSGLATEESTGWDHRQKNGQESSDCSCNSVARSRCPRYRCRRAVIRGHKKGTAFAVPLFAPLWETAFMRPACVQAPSAECNPRRGTKDLLLFRRC